MQYNIIFLCSTIERFVKLPIILIDKAQSMLQLIFLPYKPIQDVPVYKLLFT